MKQYIVDAFTDKVFSGNQAAVCVLNEWLSDEMMMNIAMENNLSETAFAVKEGNTYRLRWFTPSDEIDLCGHATLATAFIIHKFYENQIKDIIFRTSSGDLYVSFDGDYIKMDFPAYTLNEVPVTDMMEKVCGVRPIKAFIDRDLLLIFDREDDIRNMQPNMELAKKLEGLCLGVTAKGKDYDCVSRVFAPELCVSEDPVTGSTHCMIVPYWVNELKKDVLTAFQASQRGGTIICKMKDDRVILKGKAVLYSESEIYI